jgi:hypothetical protein
MPRRHTPPLPARTCENPQCGIQFIPRKRLQVTCSRECRIRVAKRAAFTPRECAAPTCDVVFTPQHTNRQKFCCEKCNRTVSRERGLVKPLREAPRRAALARLYRRFAPPQPQPVWLPPPDFIMRGSITPRWANEADKRHGRA